MSGYQHQHVTVNNVSPVEVTPPINCSNFAFYTANGVVITDVMGNTKQIPPGAQEFISVAFGSGEARFTRSKVAFDLTGMGAPETLVITWA